MAKLDSEAENKLIKQVEQWRDSFINLSPRKNNLLNQYPPKSNAIIFEVNTSCTYDYFWKITSGNAPVNKRGEKIKSFAINSGNNYTDRLIVPPIEWHAEKSGKKDLDLLDNIIDTAKTAIVQKGENPICLTFGKLTWHILKPENRFGEEPDYGKVIKIDTDGVVKEFVQIETPLILIPVLIQRVGSNYWLQCVEEEATFNPALYLKFQQEGYQMFPLPDDSQLIDKETFDIKAYFELLEKHFSDNKSFSFDKNYVALDAFDYDRICMYRDVLKHTDEIVHNKILRAFFGEEIPVGKHSVQGIDSLDPRQSYQILDSDSSQNNVIERFVNGESFILEGPPGTGKTQTIVNMIAEAIMHEKRVLFVSGKMSALNTVMKKLQMMPGVNIDKHCLLINGEEENKKINVSETYGKLQASFSAQMAPFNNTDYLDNVRKLTRTREALVGYNKEFYNKDNSLGMSMYDIIGKMLLLGYNENFIINVKFPDSVIANLKREELDKKCSEMYDLQQILLELLNRSESIEKDVWYGFKKFELDMNDNVTVRKYAADIKHALDQIDSTLREISTVSDDKLSKVINAISGYPLAAIRAICDEDITDDLKMLYRYDSFDSDKKLIKEELKTKENYAKHVDRYFNLIDKEPSDSVYKVRELLSSSDELAEEPLSKLKEDFERLSAISDSALYLTSDHSKAAALSIKEIEALIERIEQFIEISNKMENTKNNLRNVFDNGICDFDYVELLAKMRTRWAENVKENKAPFMFRWHIKNLRALCKNVSETDFTVKYVYDVLETLSQLHVDEKTALEGHDVMKQFGLDGLTLTALGNLVTLLKMYLAEREQLSVKNVFEDTVAFYDYITQKREVITNILKAADILGIKKDVTVATIIEAAKSAEIVYEQNKRIGADEKLSKILPSIKKSVKTDWNNILRLLNMVANLRDIIHDESNSMQQDVDMFVHIISSLASRGVFSCINSLFDYWKSFYGNANWFEADVMSIHPYENMTYKDFVAWQEQIGDIDHIAQYVAYKVKTHEIEGTIEGEFFARYAREGRAAYPIAKMRDNYEIALLYAYYSRLVRMSRFVSKMSGENGITSVKSVMDEFKTADKQTVFYNRRIVDRKLYSRISRDGSKHNYLNSIPTGENVSVRRLLKTRSESIKELAPCMMMSVYSVSKLLPYDKYSFDVVIFDEASQIPAEDALTSIMRTEKQVIIAGDPKQMPAISYFKTKNPDLQLDYDDDEVGNCDSIIDFVMRAKNNAISYQKLNTHYRSHHESLIQYSNESSQLYSKHLITFPSPKARTEDFGLWDYALDGMPEFKDKLVGSGGVNVSEAQVVTRLLKRHLSKYPVPTTEDDIDKYKSVGVIVFGSKQKGTILELMKEDKELAKLASCKDNRIFSIATADEIQGDEMFEMILSLTYGRDDKGNISQAWGHLNQLPVALYKFNVAVTRARENLKFVHSISANDIDNDRLKYVADYLRQFVDVPECQFVSDTNYNTSFIEAVGKICEQKVGCDRVVYNFGASPKSYRVPISILSKDRQRVVLGIMCEQDRSGEGQGFSVREYGRTLNDILVAHGWQNMHETYAIQWIRNYLVERKRLEARLDSVINN